MKYKRLAHTPLSFSAIGLGGWPFCGGYDWGNKSALDVSSLLSVALERGINWVDTAPVYEGSEHAIGIALKGRREKLFVATKCGLVKNGAWTDHNLRTIQTQLETSLKSLQTDYIDLYQIHYPDPQFPLLEALEQLSRLQAQGKLRAIGVCNLTPAQVDTLPRDVCSLQSPFSLVRPAREHVNVCKQKEISFIAYGALHGGVLSGKYKNAPNLRRADARNYFYKGYKGDEFVGLMPLVLRMKQLAKKYECTSAQIALAWVLNQTEGFVLAGAKTTAQVIENSLSCEVQITPADLHFLEEGYATKCI